MNIEEAPEQTAPVCRDMEDRLVEIDRRIQVSQQSADDDALPMSDLTGVKVPSVMGYEYVLLNKCHVGLNPRSEHPGFRILGFFTTPDAAKAHVETLKRDSRSANEIGDIHLLPRMKWMLIAKTKVRDQSKLYVLGKIDELLELHKEERRMADEEFDANRAKKSVGKIGATLTKRREKQQQYAKKQHKQSARIAAAVSSVKEMRAKAEADAKLLVAPVTRNSEIRRQVHAVIAVLQDFTANAIKLRDVPEPAVLFIDCFDTLEAAQTHIKTVLKKYIRIIDMDVVDMYEWVFPEAMDAEKLAPEAEEWRTDELTKVMRQRKSPAGTAIPGTNTTRLMDDTIVDVTEIAPNPDTASGSVVYTSAAPGASLLPDESAKDEKTAIDHAAV